MENILNDNNESILSDNNEIILIIIRANIFNENNDKCL